MVCREADEHLALPVVVTASAESDQVVAGQRPKLPAKPQKVFSTTSTTSAAAVLTVMHDCACIALQIGFFCLMAEESCDLDGRESCDLDGRRVM